MSDKNILIIENDPTAALALEMLIQRTGCTIIKIIDHPGEALQFVKNTDPDLIIININIKRKENGAQLVQWIESKHIPMIVIPGFKTAEGDCSAGKQKWHSHVMLTLGALFGTKADDRDDCTLKNSIFLKKGHAMCKVPFNSIIYVKAEGDYCEFQTTTGKFIHKVTLIKLLASLPKRHFLQTHRSYLIHLQHINHVSLSRNEIGLDKFHVPIGRMYKTALLGCLQQIG